MKKNPYRYTGPLDPIRDQLVLVPRTHDLARVCEGIANGEYWVILGPRQSGKTTFLRQIENKMENTLNLYFSFEVCPRKEKNFYQWLIEKFFVEIPSEHNKYTPKKWRDVDTASQFFGFLKEFKPKEERQKILLLFEEIEGIPALKSFLQIWRKVYSYREEGLKKYAVVMAGSDELVSLSDGKTSLFNIANSLYMKDFSPEESRRLIDGSFSQLNIKITSTAKEKLLSQVSGHPRLLQHACYLLVETAFQKSRTIVEKDIDNVIITLLKENVMVAILKKDVNDNIPLNPLIQNIFAGKKIPFYLNREFSIKGAGCIVEDEQGNCAIRNKVYEKFLKDFLSLHPLEKPSVFISYSRKDKKWKEKLSKHLRILESQNFLNIWEDQKISVGDKWYEKIKESINAANIVIFLISANSLTSDFIMNIEIPFILRRKEKEGILFFPVLVEHCAWKSVKWLGRMQMWPTDGKPLEVRRQVEQNRILAEIVKDIVDYLKLSQIEEEAYRSDRILEADDSESKAREFISECNYPEGGKCLVEASNYDPDRKERLSKEFGFLYDFSDSMEKSKEYREKKKEQIKWRQQIWRILSSRNPFEIKKDDSTSIPEPTIDESKKTQGKETSKKHKVTYDVKGKNPEIIGEELEEIMKQLLEGFSRCVDSDDFRLIKARQQKGGPQQGYDLEFVYEIKGNRELKVLFECKNLKNEVRLKDISDKLDSAKAKHRDVPIDHWVLISPRADVSNELNNLLDLWEKVDEYPFKVQVWSPETRVSQFFGLIPEIYDIFYKPKKGEIHPINWSETQKEEVVKFWKQKLAPPLRLPKGWKEYLHSPENFEIEGDPPGLDDLYKHHVTLNCIEEFVGPVQGKTLEEKVLEWLEKPVEQHPTLILLGEFGDGKTVFAYIISRKLAEKFLESPSTGWLPVRFSLKDFSGESVKDSRDFVRRRLEEFGADVAGWLKLKRSQYKLLAILDGFDEISKKLDHITILKNIKQIIQCFEKDFSGIKLLITSRKHFFENQEHKDQLLQRIGDPELIQIAPIDRKKTEEHLLEYSILIKEEEKFNRLKDYHDPIGLASKPLFLEMVKVSLKELPNQDLDELVLYETYTQKSLGRKFEGLEAEDLGTEKKIIIENMIDILENIAAELHRSGGEFIYLSDMKESPRLLERLWKMSDPKYCEYDDEIGRVAVRSLLKRIGTGFSQEGKQWPVDFCHRSMREYFVARAVCKLLENNQEQAKGFLKICYLSHEIVFFAGKIMKKSSFGYTEILWQLVSETKNHIKEKKFKVGHLGTNAANLLFQYRGSLPHNDWDKLVLDGVDFSGADLSGKNFSYTSFHYANLDNVNFTNAIFCHSDLTGVRLEEASSVQTIDVSRDENIYALYNDGNIREWNYKRVRSPYSVNLEQIQRPREARLIAQPVNDISLVVQQQLFFYDKGDEQLKQKAQIDIKTNLKPIKISFNSFLFIEEKDNQFILQLVDLEKQTLVKSMNIEPFTICDHLGTNAFITFNKKQGLQIVDTTPQRRQTLAPSQSKDITSLAACPCKDFPDQYRLAYGQADGTVVILQVDLRKWRVSPVSHCHYHEKAVNDIVFIDEGRILSGGFDKKIFLVHIRKIEKSRYEPIEFKLTLHCQGMKIDGIQPDEKRLFLEKLISNHHCGERNKNLWKSV